MIDNLKDFHAKLTTPQAAAFVGLGVSSLEKLRVVGGGRPFSKLVGGLLRPRLGAMVWKAPALLNVRDLLRG